MHYSYDAKTENCCEIGFGFYFDSPFCCSFSLITHNKCECRLFLFTHNKSERYAHQHRCISVLLMPGDHLNLLLDHNNVYVKCTCSDIVVWLSTELHWTNVHISKKIQLISYCVLIRGRRTNQQINISKQLKSDFCLTLLWEFEKKKK